MRPHIEGALRFINEGRKNGENVLVHCAAGISRSSTIVVAYMMAKYGIEFDEAVQRVRSKRGCICPNTGFESQLKSIGVQTLRSYIS